MALIDFLISTYRMIMIILVCFYMAPIAFLFFAMGKSVDWGHDHLRRLWSGSILFLCFIRSKAVGVENLSPDQVYIFLSNHKSEWDWYLFTHYIPCNWRATIRADLTKFPLVGKMAARLEQIYLKPKGGVDSMVEQCLPHIQQGRSILMYPEGRRTKSEFLDEFRIGSFVLAVRSNLPVVPVAIIEQKPEQKPGAYGRRFGRLTGLIKVIVGKPIFPPVGAIESKTVEKLRSEAYKVMLQTIQAEKKGK